MLALYHGADAALVDDAVARAVAAAQRGDPSVEISRYDGDSIEPRELAAALSSYSLFAASRLVVVTGIAAAVQKEGRLRDVLAQALPALPPGLEVLFRERRELGAGHPLPTAVKAAGGEVVNAGRLEQRDFPAKLLEVARELDIRITPPAVELLAARCQSELEVDGREQVRPDLTRGRSELLKLAAYAGAGQVVGEEMVRALVEEPDEKVFAFTDALAERQLARANAALDHLLEQGHVPQVLFALVVRQFRLLLLFAAGQAERGDTDFLRRGEHRLRDFQLRALARQAPRFSLERLRGILGLLLQADAAIKTGKLDAEEGLRLLTASLCFGGNLLPRPEGE